MAVDFLQSPTDERDERFRAATLSLCQNQTLIDSFLPLHRHEKSNAPRKKKKPRTIIQPTQDSPSYPYVQGQTSVTGARIHLGSYMPRRMWYRGGLLIDLGGSSRRRLLSSRLLSGLGSLALLLLGGISSTGGLTLSAVGRGPEGKVVAEELHDEGAVAVRLLRQGVELGNSIVEGLLREVASTVGRVQDLVVENGEVESKAKTDGVSRSELGLSNVGGALLGTAVSEGHQGPGSCGM